MNPDKFENIAHKYHYTHSLPHNNFPDPDWADDSFWDALLGGLINLFGGN